MSPHDFDGDIPPSLVEQAEELTIKTRAMDEAPIGITIADMTLSDEPLVYINEGFERLTGYSAAETLGRNCRFLQGADTETEPIAEMRAAIDADEPVQVEVLNYRKDGSEYWSEVTLAPVPDDDGSVRYYVGFQQEITQRKEYERQLEDQRDDLATLIRLLRHDVRNDLHLAMGNAEMLREHVDEEGTQHVETILESVCHAVDLADTAREMAQLMLEEESDQLKVTLSGCLRSAIETCRSAHDHAVIDVDRALPDRSVRATALLESVFDNLLQNAIRHNDTERPEVTVSVDTTDEAAIVRIADNGPGIPDELKTHVFERGRKGSESDGTGVGLYLVETLLSEYGGEIRVEDNDPRGAVFVVSLPLDNR